jgi:NAD(P)-dependent dehydrogenase (short-subunit alcohol dehydrogenase family)
MGFWPFRRRSRLAADSEVVFQKPLGKLEGKVALITGAGSGLGRATALIFAAAGAKIVVVDRDLAGAKAVAREIEDAGGTAVPIEADVSKAADSQRMIASAVKKFGRLDILLNNAGVMSSGMLHEVSEEEWDRVMAINLKSVFLSCKFALPELMKNRGVILNTGSFAGLEGRNGHAQYGASKAAVINLTKTIALEYAVHGVRANCVCPGPFATNILKDGLKDVSPEALRQLGRMTMAGVPMGRVGDPAELARASLFLCSDDASFITGDVLVVDGGAMAGHYMPIAAPLTAPASVSAVAVPPPKEVFAAEGERPSVAYGCAAGTAITGVSGENERPYIPYGC